MRVVSFLMLAVTVSAQVHHPSWWTWVEPGSSALVGIRWDILRVSKVGPGFETVLFAQDKLALPALECFKQSEQILLSGPRLEAVSFGGCTLAQLREQASRKGYRRGAIEQNEIWISPTWTLAHLGGKLVLAGPRKLIEETIESAASEAGRKYTPLLAEAAQWKDRNLWVVSAGTLPVALAGFTDMQNDANHLEVATATPVKVEAAKPAAKPEPIRMMTATTANMVVPSLPAIVPVETPTAPAPATLPPPPTPRRVIKITGLDEGPKEIELPSR